MSFQELFLILDCCIEIIKNEKHGVLVFDLSSSICSEHFLHDLIEEIIAELSQSDRARLIDYTICNFQERLRLEET